MRPPEAQRNPLALVMVGLPARGKTYMAHRLARYLGWVGHETRVFNVGAYRRERLGARQPHTFFDPDNPEGSEARWQMARAALDDMLRWYREGGQVGVYDATNSTHRRRAWVRQTLLDAGVRVLFVESICDDPDLIEANIRETKLGAPDYAGMDPDQAVADFRARIAHYEEVYEPVGDHDGSYVKMWDVGRHMELHEIRGHLPGQVVSFLLNLHVVPRPIWLTRHGQSEYNLQDRIGGDPPLSTEGQRYAEALAGFVAGRVGDGRLKVWTSTLLRARQTAEPLGRPFVPWRALDEIEAGQRDGLTYEEYAERYPDEYAARAEDKLRFRFPRGESYQDVIQRVEPVIVELERQRAPVLVVSHRGVLRALYGYFMGLPRDRVPHLDVPLHTVIQLTPRAYGCAEERFAL